ncbi:MAG: glycosyl transferase, partial [Nanohaloarchaea archaeon SW_7_46_7]
QMSEEDELIVVCDSEDDSIAQSSFESKVKLVVAGEPENCSGKANAIYHGMKASKNNRVVWTDDDFKHPDNWLEQMHRDCDRYGGVSELPFFTGNNPLTILNEPIYAFTMLMAYLNNQAWGGSVMFDRDGFNEEKFLEELQKTVGDDVLLSEHLESKTVMRTHCVEIDETIRGSLERVTRFVKHVRYHEPFQTGLLTATSFLLAAAAITYPLTSFTISTVFFLTVYLAMGRKRPTFLLGYLSLIILPLFLLYGLLRRTFVWQGRRYRYNSKLDVEILEK